MFNIKELIERYNKCLPLTESEIKILRDFYIDLSFKADSLGPEFGLFKKELHIRREHFEGLFLYGELLKNKS